MSDGTDGRHMPRAALLSLLFLLFHPLVVGHFNSPNFHVHLQERMPLLPPFAAPPPPPVFSPPILSHLGPLLGNNASPQFSTSLTRGGYPQENIRQDGQIQDQNQAHIQGHIHGHIQDNIQGQIQGHIQDNIGTQRLGPLGYPGPQPPPLPPPPPALPAPSSGTRDYSQNQLPQLPSYPSGRPPYLTTFLSYQRPIDAMVDITNELGIVVMQDYAYSRGNFAFSPYGVASILVVLFEAARGDSARQVHAALKLPFDREVVRVGFRDIHRSLRGYFNHEGFLSGVTMSQSRTALLPEFRQVLRFYGYDVDLPADGFDGHPMEPPSPNPTVTLTDALSGGNLTTNVSSMSQAPQQSTTMQPSSPQTTSATDNRKQTTTSEAPSTSSTAPSTMTTTTSTTTTTTAKPTTIITTTPSPTTMPTSEKPQTGQTTKSEPPAMTTLAEEPATTTKQEMKSTTMESPTEKPQTDVTSASTSSESSLSKLVSEPESNPGSGVFSGLLMGSKLQESFNSLFPNGVESRVDDLPLESNKLPEMTVSTDATAITSTGTESSDLREETTTRLDSNDEISEEIESTQDPSDVTSKVTSVETEMPIGGSQAMKVVEATTENSKEEVTESPKSLPISDSADALLIEERIQDSGIEVTTPTADSTTTLPTTVEPFLAATYIPPPEDTPESSTESDNKPPADANTLMGESSGEAKTRTKRWSRKRRAPTAEFKFWTEVDASSSKNDSNRARRGLDDLSMQLQNGMFDTHVAHGQELFTQLPRRPFWVDGVVEEMVPVMEYTAAFPYAYIPRLHAFALEFPLDDERYRLLLLLPAERGAASLGQLLRSLARGQAPLRGVMRSLRLTRLHAVVPAFMAEGFVILTPTLQQMGIWDLFDPRRADLSGMTSTPNLYVRNIEQAVTVVVKSYVEILDIQTRTTAARSRTESFVASHPFLYFVMDAETNVALMAGKVVDPLNSRIY